MNEDERFEFGGGEVALWLDSGAIMLRVNEPNGDPVELAEHEAKELADRLVELIRKSEGQQ